PLHYLVLPDNISQLRRTVFFYPDGVGLIHGVSSHRAGHMGSCGQYWISFLENPVFMGKLPAVFNKCHNVYHNGFEITFMHGKYILPALIVILLVVSPVAGSLSKISAGAPVFIGENNVDISSGLNGCHTIAWWQNGSDINSVPAVTNLTIYAIGSDSYRMYHFNFSPDIFSGYTGPWYCVDSKPYYPAFTVNEPQMDIRVWDLDSNSDVTGQSVPV